MTTTRTHRTLEEWNKLKAEAEAKTPEVKGHPGNMRVAVYGELWQAPHSEELRNEGYEVTIHHAYRYRPAPRSHIMGITAQRIQRLMGYTREGKRLAKGGRCIVTLLAPDGRWARGTVTCHQQDTYSKHIGYVLAVNRALDYLDAR